MSNPLQDDYVAAGIPALGCDGARVALGDAYKTATGQWVIDGGVSTWEGTGNPPTGPDAAMIALVGTTHTAHVAPAHSPHPGDNVLVRALAKQARSKALSAEEEDALDWAEAQ